MSVGKARRRPNVTPQSSTRTKRRSPGKGRNKEVLKRLELARDHVYWSSGIVACCAYAISARVFPEPGRDEIGHALEGAHALLKRAGGALIDVLDDELDVTTGQWP